MIMNRMYIHLDISWDFFTEIDNIPFYDRVPSVIWFGLASILFSFGLVGMVFNNNNFFLLLLKMELMFFGINLFFIGGSVYKLEVDGLVFALLVLGVIAAESALGLGLFVIYYITQREDKLDTIFSNEIDEFIQF